MRGASARAVGPQEFSPGRWWARPVFPTNSATLGRPRTCRRPRLVPDKSTSWNGFFESSCPKIKSIPCWTRWGSTTTNWPIIPPNAHRHHHHHLRRHEGAVGCHPEGVAKTTTTTMEARPAAAAAVEEGGVVAVGVDVTAAPPLNERA